MKIRRTEEWFLLSTHLVELPRMDAKYALAVSDLPTDMVASVADSAARDADRVGLFLHELGLSASPDQPRSLPARFLLHLAAALRLLVWETQGFFFHHDAGLPPARQAIRDAFHALHDPNANPSAFCVSVLRLSLERFAWNGPRDLQADIALDDLNEDAALDVLAEFLWASRPLATAKEDC
jgi:hypothetical protein